MGSDTAARRCLVERKYGVSRPARFECANFLKIFTLKKQQGPARLIQPRTRQHRCALDVRTNPLVRRANAIKVERHNCKTIGLAGLLPMLCFAIRALAFEFKPRS